jgi:hypothetical protein
VANNVIGKDPNAAKQLSRDEITRCEENSKATLRMLEQTRDYIEAKKKQVRGKSRYTPVARRQDKPDAIAWLLKNAQGIKDSQIIKLVGTTKKTIAGLRDRSHWNYANIKPRDPVLLGLCSQYDLDAAFAKLTPVKEEGKDKPQDTPSDASASE